MSGPFKLTSTLSMDSTEFKAALNSAGMSALEFKRNQEKLFTEAATIAKFYGVKVKDVMREVVSAQKQAQKEQEKIQKADADAKKDALKRQEAYARQITKDFENQQQQQQKIVNQNAREVAAFEKSEYKRRERELKEHHKEIEREVKEHAKIMNDSLKSSKGERDGLLTVIKKGAEWSGASGGAPSGGMSGGFFAGFTILWDTFKTAASAAWSVVTSAATTAWDTIKSISSTVLDGILSSIDRVQQQWKKSVNFATSLDSIQKLDFASQMSGTHIQTMEVAMRRMESHIGKATFGNKTSKGIFDMLGLDAGNLASMDVTSQFLAINEAMEKIDNVAQRGAMSMKLFGIAGIRETQFLRELKENASVFDRYMTRLSEFDGAKIDGAKKSFTIISAEIKNIYDQIAAKLAPIITNVVDQMEKWGLTSKNLSGFIDSAFLSFAELFKASIQFGMTFADIWPQIWTAAKNMFENIAAYLGSLSKSFGEFILSIEPAISTISNVMKYEEYRREKASLEQEARGQKIARDRAIEAAKPENVYNSVKAQLGTNYNGFGDIVKSEIENKQASANNLANQYLSTMQKLSDLEVKRAKDLAAPSILESIGESLKNGTGFKDVFLGVGNEFKDLVQKFKESYQMNDNAARELANKLLYGTALDKAKDAVTGKPINGEPDDALKDPSKEAKHNPLGYAINTTGHFADPFTMRVAATDDNPVADKQTHSHLKEIHNTLKKDRVARAA